MKITRIILVAVANSVVVRAFQSTAFVRRTTVLYMGLDLSGNSWKPDSEKMGSTDTGDYFPEGYDPKQQALFSEGMFGSQAMLNKDRDGPQLPGLENLGADAIMMGGIEQASEIPAGMEFIPSSVPDGEFFMNVASGASTAATLKISVKPVCMTFEDFYAAFSTNSHKSFSVSPQTGRMDRRGGQPTDLIVSCNVAGQAGEFVGNLVINLPEDNSKICYRIVAQAF